MTSDHRDLVETAGIEPAKGSARRRWWLGGLVALVALAVPSVAGAYLPSNVRSAINYYWSPFPTQIATNCTNNGALHVCWSQTEMSSTTLIEADDVVWCDPGCYVAEVLNEQVIYAPGGLPRPQRAPGRASKRR